jgi:hypothetical protein
MTRLSFLVVISIVGATGCRGCGGGPITNLRADLRTNNPNGQALSGLDFTACPTLDEERKPVRDVFPDSEPVVLSNQTGKAGAKAKFTFSGADADAFQLRIGGGDGGAFTVVPTPYVLDISVGEDRTFEVAFAPTKKGAHSATLNIDDQDAETKSDPVITLIGTGLDLPSQPTLETGVQQEDGGYTVCEQGSLYGDCELGFPLIQFETAVTKKIRITNKGCPALKVSSIKVAIDTLGTESPDFKLVSPAPPSTAAPLSLNSADGTATLEATIEFKPTDTGAGNEVKQGYVIIDSNDPVNRSPISAPGVLGLRGEGLRPALSASPTSCDFSRDSDLCGNSTRIPNRARFIVRNDGNAPVKITEAKFKSGTGQGGRFAMVMNPTNQEISPGMAIPLEVTHTDMPLYVIDELQLKSVFVGTNVPSGDASFALFGGSQPCLDTVDEVNFNNPQTPMSAQSFFIGNTRRLSDGGTDSSKCGTLVINQIGIEQSMFFSIIDPKIAPNTSVPPGMRIETAIQYNRPPSGGMQVGKLKVLSNDPFFGPPAGTKEINIISASPFDPPPLAVLKGCVPAQLINDPNCSVSGSETQMTVQLSMITQNPKTITVSGFDSTDSDGMTVGKPSEFRFQLLGTYPPGASPMSMVPNTRGTANKAVLTLPGQGVYRVNLTVWDSRGQQGTPVLLIVSVVP